MAFENGSVRNIVLVHGAWADGAGWQRVHDALRARGYHVSVVQNPLTSLADDVAAVITEVRGSHAVYISQPDTVADAIDAAASAIAEETRSSRTRSSEAR